MHKTNGARHARAPALGSLTLVRTHDFAPGKHMTLRGFDELIPL